ncbi:hypothetical protein QQS21_001826 [Conoideocrella luteorostrata]|uniref:Transcription factor Rba50 n=1 Tax=Conoideocrella luteorostrata TaxID=1105319 RepID=A0AAJ0CW58_9HYPO|nr:hypothetical protein QQS21_001826 [Conoideocrella luteorostrata]
MDPTLLIGDIVERDLSEKKKPVQFPAPSSSSAGFPQHKRRWNTSAFKQQRAGTYSKHGPTSQSNTDGYALNALRPGDSQPQNFQDAERQRIDHENQRKLASMTPQEIAQAQDDIMEGLNPALIKRLLQRADIDEPSSSPSPFHIPNKNISYDTQLRSSERIPSPPINILNPDQDQSEETGFARAKTVAKSVAECNDQTTSSKTLVDQYDEDRAPAQIPPDLFPITDLPKSTHFPVPPSFPDLDPSDPNFLATLHEKYFPNLPADPSKLAWMAPVPTKDSPADRDSSYYPHPEIAVSALRFDFRGRFLSPRVSRSIPSTMGLHHHGEAPEAAGYTITELARLARSAVPAQRCMAYQTLGRILYRLGKGEWGKTENDAIAVGIWAAVKKGRVLDSLLEAAAGEGGHRGSRTYATEALWLFERGGWKETFKGR